MMDNLGNRSEGDTRKRRYVGSHSERTPRPRGQVLRSDSRTMAEGLRSLPIKREPEPQLHCQLCPENRALRGRGAFWGHMGANHHPGELLAALKAFPLSEPDPLDDIESTLIRIVNSVTHDEAVGIATAALCGK